jgi:hypothetical protein
MAMQALDRTAEPYRLAPACTSPNEIMRRLCSKYEPHGIQAFTQGGRPSRLFAMNITGDEAQVVGQLIRIAQTFSRGRVL